MKNILKILLVVIVAVYFSGCIDEPVQQNNDVISGTVYGVFPPYFINVNNQNNTISDHYGNFSLSTTSNPFTLTVFKADSLFYVRLFKFENITLNHPQIIDEIWNNPFPLRYFFKNTCNVTVKYPSEQHGKHIFLHFVSNEKFDQDVRFRTGGNGTDSASLTVYLENNKSSIQGQLIYLDASYTVDTTFHFISYDRFGIKNITLNSGENPEINFTPEEISFNPEEYDIPVNINISPEFEFGRADLYINIPGTYKSSDIYVYSTGTNGNILLPMLSLNNYKYKVVTFYSNRDLWGHDWSCVEPGDPANITVTNAVKLMNPPPYAENVKSETIFEIEDNSPSGLYEYIIEILSFDLQPKIRVFTNKKHLKFSDFYNGYIELPHGIHCKWQVRKFNDFKSADEFISQPYVIDNKAERIELTTARSFKTAP